MYKMGFITEETHNEVVKAYEAQITELKNEVEALRAVNEVETQNYDRTKEAKLEGTTYDILQQLTRGAK